MPSDVTLLLRHLLPSKGVLMSPLCSFVTPLPRLCSFKGVLSFIFSDSLSLCFSHPCNGFSLAPWHFSSMFFFRLVFFSPLFSNLNAIVTFVDLINIYLLCDNIFVLTYVMCDLPLKIHPLNFGNAYLECFASEPCFQHDSGWSFCLFCCCCAPFLLLSVQCPSCLFPIISEACDTLIISAGLLISLFLLKSFWFSTLDLTDSSSDDLFCFSLKDSSFQHLQHLPLSMMSKCSIPRGTMQ